MDSHASGGAVDVCPVLDTADQEGVGVVEYAEGDAIVAASCDSPALQLVSERLRHPVWVCGQRCGDELGDRGRHFVRKSIECADRTGCQPDSPWLLVAHDKP